MLAGSRRRLACAALVALAPLAATRLARAEPDPCSLRATLSPCFDADPVWLASGPSPFVTLPSPRALAPGAWSLLAGAGLAVRPVTLVAPSPHPEGRVVPVVDLTSTLTLAARFGLGRGIDVHAALPLVPYQSGTGAEGVTSQRGPRLGPVTLRDPRFGASAAILGGAGSPFALGTHLDVALPLGEARALAGAPGPTIAPAFAGAFATGRLALGADLALRLRRAVTFGSVRPGSELVAGAGVAVTLLRAPELALALESFLRAPLTSPPVGSQGDRSLPAEWLASAHFRPARARWSLLAGGGSGLPLSRARPAGDSRPALGVTAPRLRALASFRYEL